MKLINAINIGKKCGLRSIKECIDNIEIHSVNFFPYAEIDNQINQLMLDVENLSIKYDETQESVLNWSIKEYELYER